MTKTKTICSTQYLMRTEKIIQQTLYIQCMIKKKSSSANVAMSSDSFVAATVYIINNQIIAYMMA